MILVTPIEEQGIQQQKRNQQAAERKPPRPHEAYQNFGRLLLPLTATITQASLGSRSLAHLMRPRALHQSSSHRFAWRRALP